MSSNNVTTAQWRLVALQMCSQPEPSQNLLAIRAQLLALAEKPAQLQQLVVLPEGALCFGAEANANLQLQEPLGHGPVQTQLAALAQEFQSYLLVGTFPTTTADTEKFAASSLLFSPEGKLIADYQKIHLFDAAVADNTGLYQESAKTQAGNKITVADLAELQLGLAVCYDMRFPGLFQALGKRGMNVLALPSAFTTVTGEAHWHTLLKARAIETQSFVIAPAQTGIHANGRETYGHSLIIDPWGVVLADAGTAVGAISVDIDLQQVFSLRQRMPLAQHNRFLSELL
ncbi:carbon-nitrogen hydrolase family protein [Rheinheimera sp.]|uniref:carbon-nitrogen hydrolase family protein n=1 Tax=Rheinheimera sp. TaxID=1869214 RepID=UPI0027BAC3A3|nr:carbon-nitrogen hydrolase family protein [Rheinheimera sp.]